MTTTGCNAETVFPVKGIRYEMYDVGGQETLRALWRYYYKNSQGLVYVVDSSDHARIDETRDALSRVLRADDMKEVPLVVMANKQDVPGAVTPEELVDILRLCDLEDHPWHVEGTCAANGDGLRESMETLVRLVTDYQGRTRNVPLEAK